MNISEPVRDTDRYYLYDEIFDAIHRQGGMAGYAHAANEMFEVHRDMTLNVPRDRIDFFEIQQFNNLGTNLYYDFLNLGYKITASAGSDLPWGGTVGEVRVYSYMGDEPFSADAWFAAFQRGRTFTTSGPMIDFKVDEALPGDELRITEPGRRLRVRARAWADPGVPTPVRLEIVQHGEIIRVAQSEDPRRPEAALDFMIDAADGSWIAARAYTGARTNAHTTPVYVVREGLRFWKHESVDELLVKRETSLRQIEQVVSDAQDADRGGRLESDRHRKQLAVNGPELLQRVAAAREGYSALQRTAEAERSRRTSASESGIARVPPGWELAFEQNFPLGDFPRWRLEGSAELSVPMERMLRIDTRRGYINGEATHASTVWFDEPVAGDVRFEFDASAEPGTAGSFFFHARRRDGASAVEALASRARFADYAGGEWSSMYAIDILRSDAPTIALRRFGGAQSADIARELALVPDGDPREGALRERFDRLTVLQRVANPATENAQDRVYHFDLRIKGGRITLLIDNRIVFETAFEGDVSTGGYFGIHNARPGSIWFDNLRVYRAADGG